MNKAIKHLGLLMLTAMLFATTGCAPKLASFEDLRLRQKERITGGNLDLSDTLVVERITAMDASLEKVWGSMNKAEDRTFLWDDRECEDDPVEPWRPTSVTIPITRLSHMAAAYATQGTKFYLNDSLKNDIVAGMEWMYANKWSPEHEAYGNWWDWIIGMPRSVNNMLICMYDEFTPEQRAKYIEALNFYAPDVTYEGASTGANKVWQCASMIQRGILAENEEMIKMGVEGVATEYKYVDTHDGYYKDGSFLQHQWHPYTGGYGAGLLRDFVSVNSMVYGSPWAVSEELTDMLGGFIENSYLPLIYQGAIMDMVRGRELVRGNDRTAGHSILRSAYEYAQVAPADVRERLLSRVKYEFLSDKFRDVVKESTPLYQLSQMQAFLADPAIEAKAPAPYYKPFPMMDRFVQVRPNFAMGLALSSSRIENFEAIDTENIKAWHVGDGMTYFYNGDQAQYSDKFWITVDYYRLPGTTVAVQEHEAKTLPFGEGILYADGYKSPKSWVGGSQLDDQFGMIGMWFVDEKSTLEARKSWFVVGDDILAFGAGVRSNDSYTIETIVDNRKVAGEPTITQNGKVILTKNGAVKGNTRWIQLTSTVEGTDMGYFFPESAEVNILRESREATHREVSKYGSTEVVGRDFITLWVDHGKRVKDDTYAYVVLPGATAEQMATYAENPNIQILANTPTLQAAEALREGVKAYNFWETPSEAICGVKVSAPASVICQDLGETIVVALSDPTQLVQGEITLEMDIEVSGVVSENPNVKVLSTSPLTLAVDVTGAMGQSFALTLQK